MRINLNVQGCGIVAASMHAPSRTSLLLPLLLSHNLPLLTVHYCVMGRIVHTGLGRRPYTDASVSPKWGTHFYGTEKIATSRIQRTRIATVTSRTSSLEHPAN